MKAATSPPAPTGPRHVTMEHLWALAVLTCLWAFVATHPIRPHDFWWHLEIGREIVTTGHIPQVDAFSYTASGAPYPSYNIYWLADAALYLVYAAGGPALSVFVQSLLITLTYGLILGLCWKLSGSGRIAALCTLGAAACGFENWNVRPQAIAFLLAAVYLCLIYTLRSPGADRLGRRDDERVRDGRAHAGWLALLAFPLLMVVWVNCHGSFPLGIVLLGLWFVDEVRAPRRAWLLPLVALALTAPAMLLNPQGFGVFAYLRAMGDNPLVQRLPEWAPASFATKDGIAFFVVLGLSAVVLAASWRRLRLFHVLTFVCFALLAWKTGRAIIWFGLAVPPVLAELLPALLPTNATETKAPDRAERLVNTVFAAGLLALMLITLPWFKDRLPMPEQKAGLVSSETPVAATGYLLQHRLPLRLFHDMAYGSYLIWAAQPRYQVFVDPRIELYPEAVWDEYDAISAGESGWEGRLSRWGVNTLLLDLKQQAGLVARASRSGRWREVYRDGHAVIFVRRS